MVPSQTTQHTLQWVLGLTVSVSAMLLAAGTAQAAVTELDTSEPTQVVIKNSTTAVTSAGEQSASGPIQPSSGITGDSQTGMIPKQQPTDDGTVVSLTTGTVPSAETDPTNLNSSSTEQPAVVSTGSAQGSNVTPPQSIAVVNSPAYRSANGVGGVVGLRYGNNVMPLQPIMTAAAPRDLAALVPTSPERLPTDSVPHSTSLLGQLTMKLAGVVVPVAVLLVALGTGSLTGSFALPLIFLNLAFAALTYGLWLRRSGYSTAARSDLPAAFTFATPRLMGYDRGQLPRIT
jgi:hypothetical protein